MEIKAAPTPQEVNKPVAPKESGFGAKVDGAKQNIINFLKKPSSQEHPKAATQAIARESSESSTDSAELKNANNLLKTFVDIKKGLIKFKNTSLAFPLTAAATGIVLHFAGAGTEASMASEVAFTAISTLGGNFKDTLRTVAKTIAGAGASVGIDNLPIAEAAAAGGYIFQNKDVISGVAHEVMHNEVIKDAIQGARRLMPSREQIRPAISKESHIDNLSIAQAGAVVGNMF